MNKDAQLKKTEQKFIFLICGNSKVGKLSITKKYLKQFQNVKYEEKSFYRSYQFQFDYKGQNDVVWKIPAEIRILNSEEIETELKINKAFFEGALGGIVVVSLENFITFTEGLKWKEKMDLMCCLPNRFPLPIILLVNKCDLLSEDKRQEWIEKINVDNYVKENQYFYHYYFENSGEDSQEEIQNSEGKKWGEEGEVKAWGGENNYNEINTNTNSNSNLNNEIHSGDKGNDANVKGITQNQNEAFEKLIDFALGFKDIQALFNTGAVQTNNVPAKGKDKKDGGCCII